MVYEDADALPRRPKKKSTDKPTIYGLVQVGTGRCPRGLTPRRSCKGPSCWCMTRLNDHSATYRDDSGRKLVVWAPYEITDLEEFGVLSYYADSDGLELAITGCSPYSPDTIAIEFRLKEQA
jgi:hypothetical protein